MQIIRSNHLFVYVRHKIISNSFINQFSLNILPPFSLNSGEVLSKTTQLICFLAFPRYANIFNGDVPLIEMFILLVLIEGTESKSGSTSPLICVCTQTPRWPSLLFCHCSLEITTASHTGFVGVGAMMQCVRKTTLLSDRKPI